MALLQQFETAFGPIRVMRSARDGSMAYYQNGCFHSQVNKNGVSICVYVHAINEIIRQIHAKDVLIIGCAGGSMATMLRHLNCKVTVVDINAAAFTIARRWFHLPDDVRCIRRDGIAYLRATKKRYDAIVIDVFGSNNGVPRAFTTTPFFELVKTTLSASGVMIMNVITADDRDMQADRIARNVQAAGLPVTLFDWPGQKDRNTIITGGHLPYLRIPSGHEPRWIKADFHGIVRRQARKYRAM